MCRWLAYTGAPILMSELILKPKDNLIHQSLHARTMSQTTNGDGFGIGWYDKQPYPGQFRSIRPAWNDTNVDDLASHIESHLFLSHVRASSLAPVQETNCHPFKYRNWLFQHNGQIAQFQLLHQKLLAKISPEFFNDIEGSTDSEIMFYLALTLGLENDVPGGVARMIELIHSEGKAAGVSGDVWMTLAISDGKDLWGFRYGSDGKSPTLFLSPSIQELANLSPNIEGKFGDFAACLVSEPIGNYQQTWKEVPEKSVVKISNKQIEVFEFVLSA